MATVWKTLRVVVELPVSPTADYSERDLRWAVDRLIGGSKIHAEINRFRFGNATVIETGRARVKQLSRVLAAMKRNP